MKKQVYYFGILCMAIGLLITGCKKDFLDFYPAVHPEFVLPAAKGRITIGDYYKDTVLVADPITKLYKFVQEQDLPINFSFDTIVKIDDVTGDEFSFKFDEFKVPDQNPNPAEIVLADFGIGAINALDGTIAPVPTFGDQVLPDAKKPIISLGDSVDFVNLSDGTLNINIANNFTFPVTVTITLKNNVSGHTEVLGTDTKTINQGLNANNTISLAGKTVYNTLVLESIISSAGTGSNSVPINISANKLITTFSLTNLEAQSGRAKINTSNNNVNRNDTIRIGGLGNGAILKEVLFNDGNISFTPSGDVSVLNLAITSAGITRANNAPFVINEGGLSESLNGYKFLFTTVLNDSNYVLVNTIAGVKADVDGFVTFDTQNEIKFSPTITGAKFRRIEGYLGSQKILSTQTIGLIDSTTSFLQNINAGAISFDSVAARIEITSSIGIPVGMTIDLQARSNFGTNYDVLENFDKMILPATEANGAPIETDATIVLESDKMVKLINSIPKSLTSTALIEVNKGVMPNVNAGNFVYNDSKLTGKLYLEAPLSIFFDNLTFADTVAFDQTIEDIAEIKDANGFLQLNLKNGFNIAMSIMVSTLDSTMTPIDTLASPAIGTIAAGIANSDGRVITATPTTLKFPIDLSTYKKLQNARSLRIQAVVDSGNDQPTNIYSDSYIDFNAVIDISLLYDKDE